MNSLTGLFADKVFHRLVSSLTGQYAVADDVLTGHFTDMTFH